MIIPLLTQILPDVSQRADAASKPRAPSGPETRARRDDDRDFASVMADRKRDDRKDVREPDRPQDQRKPDPVADARQSPEKPAEKPAADADGEAEAHLDRETDAAAPELVQAEPQRRQVTIPDLPVKRTPAALAGQGEAAGEGATHATNETAAPAAAAGADLAVPQADAPVAPEDVQAAAIATKPQTPATLLRLGAASGLTNAPLGLQTGEAPPTQATDPELSLRAGAMGEVAKEGTPRHREIPPMGAEASAQAVSSAHVAQQVTQAVRARDIVHAAAQSAAEDRRAARTAEPVARGLEAAAPVPIPQATAAQASGAAQMAVLQSATRDGIAGKEKPASALTLEGETESLRFDMRGGSGTTGTQHASFAATVARGDMGRHVAMQIADFARTMPDRPVDVSLSPEELGRVRLSISTGDGGVILQVLAERPETLDLMRRHADQLARELADLGFTSIDLAFGQGRDSESGSGDGTSAGGGSAKTTEDTGTTAAEDPAQPRLTLTESGGIDIRI